MSMKAENMTHPSLTPDDLISELMFNVEQAPAAGYRLPPMMIWGQPGVGKSDIVKQVGLNTNRPVIDIRLLLKDPTDLSGLPYFNPINKKMEYGAPSELPPSSRELLELEAQMKTLKIEAIEPSMVPPTSDELDEINSKIKNDNLTEVTDDERSKLMYLVRQGRALILLDEISSAAPAVQAAALQLVLDRRIGTYVLPKEVSIVAAGNRSEDNTVHFSMPTPLRNRFSHFTLVSDYDSWERWAIRNKIHPIVVGFLKANSGKLNAFDPKQRHVYAFATPRTWEFVSRVLWALSDENAVVRGENNKARLSNQVQSLVGTGVGTEFMASFDVIGQLPDAMDILDGKIKKFNMEDLKSSASYSLIVNLCHRMHEVQNRMKADKKSGKIKDGVYHETMQKFGNNFLDFMMENLDFQEDFIIMGATIAFSQYNLEITDCDSVERLLDEHHTILTMI